MIMLVLWGMLVTLAIRGYQFGQSNHGVYLLDAMRQASPDLLKNDWFTAHTLQYHAVFGWMTGELYRLGWIEPAFLIGYVLLLAMMHVAWYRLALRLGGGPVTYVLSVVFYALSAGGTGLGMYQFLQDASFLPSNVANVAMLWGILLWMERRFGWAGIALGTSGVFHLNHAIVAVGLWGALVLWDVWRPVEGGRFAGRGRGLLIGSLGVATCGISIALALRATLGRSWGMPLEEFVDLYVRLRHPHHYDPSSWPAALWVSFLWPIPLAVLAWWSARSERDQLEPVRVARIESGRIVLLLGALIGVALLGAGLFYVSETLVQMSLYRFSIHVKLLTCIGAAYLLWDRRLVPRGVMVGLLIGVPILLAGLVGWPWREGSLMEGVRERLFAPLVVLIGLLAGAAVYVIFEKRVAPRGVIGWPVAAALLVLFVIGWPGWFGMNFVRQDDPRLLAFGKRLSDPAVTDPDAIFLVSPHEQLFRLNAQRAVVVNFKNVPQLSGEMVEWRRRMERVLDLDDLRTLPHGLGATLDAIHARYEALPTAHLLDVAREYGARYLIVEHRLEPAYEPMLYLTDETGSLFLYDLRR